MSYEAGIAALHLEMPDVVPRTEYSVEEGSIFERIFFSQKKRSYSSLLKKRFVPKRGKTVLG